MTKIALLRTPIVHVDMTHLEVIITQKKYVEIC